MALNWNELWSFMWPLKAEIFRGFNNHLSSPKAFILTYISRQHRVGFLACKRLL